MGATLNVKIAVSDTSCLSRSASARISHADAAAAVDLLMMRYFEQRDQATADDIQPLCIIQSRIEWISCVWRLRNSRL